MEIKIKQISLWNQLIKKAQSTTKLVNHEFIKKT
jgi:hypothetical protein